MPDKETFVNPEALTRAGFVPKAGVTIRDLRDGYTVSAGVGRPRNEWIGITYAFGRCPCEECGHAGIGQCLHDECECCLLICGKLPRDPRKW
jgi:hypothetical protein